MGKKQKQKVASVMSKSTLNTAFFFHLFIVILAWVGPFLFSWYLMVLAYTIVTLQFIFLKKCVLNASHGLETSEEDDTTFYSDLFAMLGWHPNKRVLKFWVRKLIYPLLAAFTLWWQVVMGFEPLIV